MRQRKLSLFSNNVWRCFFMRGISEVEFNSTKESNLHLTIKAASIGTVQTIWSDSLSLGMKVRVVGLYFLLMACLVVHYAYTDSASTRPTAGSSSCSHLHPHIRFFAPANKSCGDLTWEWFMWTTTTYGRKTNWANTFLLGVSHAQHGWKSENGSEGEKIIFRLGHRDGLGSQ